MCVRSIARSSCCPTCGTDSHRVHSRYQRRIADLPLAGRSVCLSAEVCRFRCAATQCGQQIFTDQVATGILAPWARCTWGLDVLVHHLGLAPGGRPAASLAKRLMLPISNDTLLRVARRRGCPVRPAPTVIGIDDWGWRRIYRYGTIICDLERRKPISLLPDCEPATAQAWLTTQPQVTVVVRGRPAWRPTD
ncbi:transposase family protein [Sphingomonas faeni]|uniref:transposase family protein n=1 Tax=Sphingomonas faeni TaxID=185950 RepID=UPI0035944373